jgi:KaiC/GvpD/RAD55 family RecA-like ATPase
MRTLKSNQEKKVKRFEDLLPKLDNGNTDWETIHRRLSQNMDAAEILLGQLPPQALEIEKALLGACLIDVTAFKKAKDVLTGYQNPFYIDAHNEIWCSMENLNTKKQTIDRLTVFNDLENRSKVGIIGGNPYLLVELTERVVSSAHVESHARILLQTYLRRKLMHLSIMLHRKASDNSADLFNIVDEHSSNLKKLIPIHSTLKRYSMPEVMDLAEQATPKAFLVGSLIKDEDVAIIFSGPENGKSIFGIQMADKISRGECLFDGLLPNDCGQRKVLYFDFELTFSDYKDRYTDGASAKYSFIGSEWMSRIGNNDNQPLAFAEIAHNIEHYLVENIESYKPNVVFVDNITAMSNGSTADAEVSKKIMDLLLLLKKKYKLTVIVLAHTPKQYDLSKPLSLADLAGSFLLAAYADSIIGIGRSKMGNTVKYILQLKCRSGKKIHDAQNVIQVSIEKEDLFLQYKPLEEPTGYESDHLVNKYDASVDEDFIKKIVMLYDQGKSYQNIKEELNLKLSRQYIGRIIKNRKDKEAEKKEDLNETNKKRNNEDAPF